MVLESQNWKLHRLWTPQYFRDPRGTVEAILTESQQMVATEDEKDAIRVSESGDPTIERPR